MPPKSPKAVTPPVCPDYVFAISYEFTITGRKKLSANMAQCAHQWIKGSQALVRLGEDSGWWRATNVQEYESGTFSVRLAKTGDGKGGRWVMERKLIVGNKGGKDRPDFICFGFFGGIFESAQGLRVKVLDADLDSSPETVTYCANFTDGENEVEQSMGLSQFLADFPPLEVEDQIEWETEGAEQGDDEIVIDMRSAPRVAQLISMAYYGPTQVSCKPQALFESLKAPELRVVLRHMLGGEATIGASENALKASLLRLETRLRMSDRVTFNECRLDLSRLTSVVEAGKGNFEVAGDIIRSVVIEKLFAEQSGETGSHEQASQSGSARKVPKKGKPSTSQCQRGAGSAALSSSESDGDDSEESSSEGDPPPKRARKTPAAAAGRDPQRTVRFDEEEVVIERKRDAEDYPAWQKLKAITPIGEDPLEAGEIFFAEERLREAAQMFLVCDPMRVMPRDRQRIRIRYSLALDRLEAHARVGALYSL